MRSAISLHVVTASGSRKSNSPHSSLNTRFVYDSDDDEIVAAVDVTHAPLPGPQVRTVVDLDSDQEPESDEEEHDAEEDEYDQEEEEEDLDQDEDMDMGVENEFYVDPSQAINDANIGALLEDVAMELAAFDMSAPHSQQQQQQQQ